MNPLFFFYRDPERAALFRLQPNIVIQVPAFKALGRLESEVVKGPYYKDKGFYSPRLGSYVKLDVFLKDPETHEYLRCPNPNEVWAQVNHVLAAHYGEITLRFGLDGNLSALEAQPT